MTLSSSATNVGQLGTLPVAAFQYRQIETLVPDEEPEFEPQVQSEPEVRMPESAFRERIAAERAAAAAEVELKYKADAEKRVQLEMARVTSALQSFDNSRTEYFAEVEREVIQLALAIVRKILHRETQIDPMLVGALVQIALGQLKEGSSVTLNVAPAEQQRWQKYFDGLGSKLAITVVEDASLQPGDCVLQTELGTANFGIEAQLKEVEQGFFDVLARRPQAG
jgi:flagellar assembly protein FliH